MQKMSLDDLKALYPPLLPPDKVDKNIKSSATAKNHKHVVNPVWLPAVGSRPAAFRHSHKGKAKKRAIIAHPVTPKKPTILPAATRVFITINSKQSRQAGYMKRFGSIPT